MGQKTLATTLLAALAIEAGGAISSAGGAALPSPRRFLATWLLWFVLGLVAASGQRAARAAGHFSILVVLAMAVVGPFGIRAVSALEAVGRYFPREGSPA